MVWCLAVCCAFPPCLTCRGPHPSWHHHKLQLEQYRITTNQNCLDDVILKAVHSMASNLVQRQSWKSFPFPVVAAVPKLGLDSMQAMPAYLIQCKLRLHCQPLKDSFGKFKFFPNETLLGSHRVQTFFLPFQVSALLDFPWISIPLPEPPSLHSVDKEGRKQGSLYQKAIWHFKIMLKKAIFECFCLGMSAWFTGMFYFFPLLQ